MPITAQKKKKQSNPMKKREIFIVIVLILFGLVYKASKDGDVEFVSFSDGCSVDHRSLIDKKYPNEYAQQEIQRENIKQIRIDNLAGNILVEKAPANDNRIRIQPSIRIYHKDKSKADQMARDIKLVTRFESLPIQPIPPLAIPIIPSTTSTTSVTPTTPSTSSTPKPAAPGASTPPPSIPPFPVETLSISVESASGFQYQRSRVYFKVIVPENVVLVLKNQYGFIDISECGNNVFIDENYGDIIARKINASVKIRHQNGEITLSEIGNIVDLTATNSRVDLKDISILKANTSYSNLFIENLKTEARIENAVYSTITANNSGKISIDGRHTEVNLSNVKGDVEIKNSYESISLEKIEGNIDISGRDCRLELDKTTSDTVVIKNSYDRVRIGSLNAKNVKIAMNHGNLFLDFQKIEESLNINNENSKITLTFPAALEPSFAIEVRHGSIHNTTLKNWEIVKERERDTLNTTTKDAKPRFTIINSYGKVVLENSEIDSNSDSPAEKETKAEKE